MCGGEGPRRRGAWPGRDVGMGGARTRALGRRENGWPPGGWGGAGGAGVRDVSSSAAESLLVWGTGLLSFSGSFPTVQL